MEAADQERVRRWIEEHATNDTSIDVGRRARAARVALKLGDDHQAAVEAILRDVWLDQIVDEAMLRSVFGRLGITPEQRGDWGRQQLAGWKTTVGEITSREQAERVIARIIRARLDKAKQRPPDGPPDAP